MFSRLCDWLYIKFYNYHVSRYENDVNADCDYYGCKECDFGLCKGSSYFGDKLPW